MQILVEEMGLCDTVDPLGGSYYVETLTDQMEEKIREVMAEVDSQGGIVKAIAEGHIQNAVSKQACQNLVDLQSGKIRKVGVNCYRLEEEEPSIEFHPFKEEDCRTQLARLERVRGERDKAAVTAALHAVSDHAREGRNVMPAIIAAVKAYATVGEITECLVEVFGKFAEPVRF